MALRALVVVAVVSVSCAVAAASPRAVTPLDVEIAVDTTGSMGPSIVRLQRGAEKLVAGIKARVPSARVALVQFKDAQDTPEYELLQPLTANGKAFAEATTRLAPGGGGDNPEAYNVVFRNSFADKAIGWRSGSRKVVVVVGDAEPHGAASSRFSGCLDASADPHRLSTRRELAAMKKAGRTLVMIRQAATASAALQCYQALAAAAYTGGGSADAGSTLVNVIQTLVGRAAGVRAPAVPAATTKTGGGTKKTGRDRTAPHVTAIKSGGYRGTNIRLLYRVTDDSGRSSERVSVLAGSRVVTKSGWAAFGPADGKLYFFDFPAPASMSGTYTFCVQSRDPSGNVAKPSCAPVVLS